MSSAWRRIFAIILVLVLLSGSFVYAGGATIISPAQNTVTTSSSLLVSVKLTEPVTIRVTVYEEKISTEAADGTKQYTSVDVSKFTKDDLGKIADVYAGKEGQTLSTGAVAAKYASVVYSKAVTFTGTGDVSFYTKQLSDITPGLYRVRVERLGENDSILETQSSFVAVQKKAEESKTNLFETKQTSAVRAIQNVLKSLFK